MDKADLSSYAIKSYSKINYIFADSYVNTTYV